MERRVRFITQDERILYKDETNRHHVAWRKDAYTTPVERRFREMGGMLLRMTITEHRELHANVPPPEKPNKHLMAGLINYNRHLHTENPYDRFYELTELLGRIASTGGRNSEDAEKLYEHFLIQSEYIEAGRLEIYRGE